MCSVHPPASAPACSDAMPGHRGSLSASPFEPKLIHGNSAPSQADVPAFAKFRAKSWTAAISELSDEAKSLTDALEAYASVNEQRREAHIQAGTLAEARPSLETMLRSRTQVVDLPPLRKNNVMIDPLPISREKEKVLSRTRPSWLPPKSQKEERKHLKEYQRMMAVAQENGRILENIP